MRKLILTITGPSASGKSTLERALCVPGSPFGRVRSVTTRPMRTGETQGVEYDFVDTETFLAMQDRGELLESNQFGPYYYGATIAGFEEIFAAGKIAVLVADPNGRKQIEQQVDDLGWDLVRVYVSNPAHVRMERLLDRFISEIEHLELGGEAFQKKKQGFAQRLALVVDEESDWDREARPVVFSPYTLKFWEFNADNHDAVVSRVCEMTVARAFGPGQNWSPAAAEQRA